MRYITLIIVFLFGITVSATADFIHGTITVEGAALANQDIEITSSSKTYSTKTDKHGSYGLKVTEKGRCTLKLKYKGQELSYTVYSQDKSARYDLVVAKDGKNWTLRRK